MLNSIIAGTFIVAASVVLVCESAVLGQALTTAPPVGKFPGPCRAWLFPCEESSWICTTEAAYWGFMFGPQPDCPNVYPNPTPPPPPGECQLVNDTCKFTESTLKCKTWFDPIYGNKCGAVTEYNTFMKRNGVSAVKAFGQGQPPAPDQLCLPINNSCRWYNPCLSWRGHCTNDNICGSLDEYYVSLYGPPPSCTPPPGEVPHDTPGQCAITKDHCDWYNCTAWTLCFSWYCGTIYEKEMMMAGPPPPCPPPPANFTPPARPGECRFNVPSGQCKFFPNTTECVSWIGWCGSSWSCGTMHEYEIFRMLLPPPCPLPPWPPVKPGTCKFSVSNGQCSFFPNKTCSAGKVYKSCGTACPKTCANYSEPKACSSQCVPGCFCPPGTVEHNGQCINPLSCPLTHKTKSDIDPCKQPIYPPGYKPTCTMLEKQWTFNSTTGQCDPFVYSPCGEEREGYDVFATQEECMRTCMHQDSCSQSIYPPGFVPHCDVLVKQWTYNKTTGQCVEFYYHPCGEEREGYDVFVSEQECIQTCIPKDRCKESIYPPGYIPSCNLVEKQWTYNKTSGKCVEFNYHPCGEEREGYDVFTTELECTKTCIQRYPCHQPIYPPGYKPTCGLLVNQWTYDAQSGQCVEFEYYPCGENRDGYDVFATKEECVNTCQH